MGRELELVCAHVIYILFWIVFLPCISSGRLFRVSPHSPPESMFYVLGDFPKKGILLHVDAVSEAVAVTQRSSSRHLLLSSPPAPLLCYLFTHLLVLLESAEPREPIRLEL